MRMKTSGILSSPSLSVSSGMAISNSMCLSELASSSLTITTSSFNFSTMCNMPTPARIIHAKQHAKQPKMINTMRRYTKQPRIGIISSGSKSIKQSIAHIVHGGIHFTVFLCGVRNKPLGEEKARNKPSGYFSVAYCVELVYVSFILFHCHSTTL